MIRTVVQSREHHRQFAKAAFVALLSLLCVSCGRRETDVASGIRTQTLHVGIGGEPEELDPHVVNTINAGRILYALFEGLTAWEEKTGQGLPAAAERWDISPDGLTYTFHLRTNLRWSNGDPLTARDFAFAYERFLQPKLAGDYAYMLWPIKGAEAFNKALISDFTKVGVRAADDRTLRIELERPTAYLPALVAHWTWFPVHRATLEKFSAVDRRGTKWTRPGNLVGNGPFTLKEWIPNGRVGVSKNAHYWDAGATGLNGVVFHPIEKSEVEEVNFRAGQMHVTYSLPMGKVPAYRAQSSAHLRADSLLGSSYLCFNTAKAPLNDARVRRALSLAIDRDALSRAVTYGTRAPAASLVPPNCGGYTARARAATDGEKARQLLSDAGYPGGKGLAEIALETLNSEHYPKLAEAMQAMWQRELGVRVSIQPLELKIWLQNMQTKTHTISLAGWIADFPDPATFLELFVTGGGNNFTNWSNAAYDGLIAEAARTSDQPARFEKFQRAEALLLDEMPVAPA